MRLITAKVSDEIYNFKKSKGIAWSYIISKGIESINNSKVMEELLEEYKQLKEKQSRTAKLLQRYADESKIDLFDSEM